MFGSVFFSNYNQRENFRLQERRRIQDFRPIFQFEGPDIIFETIGKGAPSLLKINLYYSKSSCSTNKINRFNQVKWLDAEVIDESVSYRINERDYFAKLNSQYLKTPISKDEWLIIKATTLAGESVYFTFRLNNTEEHFFNAEPTNFDSSLFTNYYGDAIYYNFIYANENDKNKILLKEKLLDEKVKFYEL